MSGAVTPESVSAMAERKARGFLGVAHAKHRANNHLDGNVLKRVVQHRDLIFAERGKSFARHALNVRAVSPHALTVKWRQHDLAVPNVLFAVEHQQRSRAEKIFEDHARRIAVFQLGAAVAEDLFVVRGVGKKRYRLRAQRNDEGNAMSLRQARECLVRSNGKAQRLDDRK